MVKPLPRIAAHLLFLLCWFAASAPAAAYTLSGTVYGGQAPLADAVVTVRDAGLGTTVASATTDSAGDYSVGGLDGVYHLTITPPAAGPYRESLIESVAVSGGDAVQHAFLIGGIATLSGTLYASDGVTPAADFGIFIVHVNGGAWDIANTADDGTFSFDLESGDYRLYIDKESCSGGSFAIPQYVDLANWQIVTVAGDTQAAFSLPAFPVVRGRTVDEAGNPVAGVSIMTRARFIVDRVVYTVANDSPGCPAHVSDADGRYEIPILAGDHAVELIPPAGGATAHTFHESLTLDGAAEVDLVVQTGVAVGGRLSAADGATPADNFRLHFHESRTGTRVAGVTSGADGSYDVDLAPGDYTVSVEREACAPSTLAAPTSLRIDGYRALTVSAPAAVDIALPLFHTLAGRVVDRDGTAVGGVDIRGRTSWSGGGTDFVSEIGDDNCPLVTAADGRYETAALAAGYQFTLEPPAQSRYITTRYGELMVDGSTPFDLLVHGPVSLSGTVYASDGVTPAANIRVRLYPAEDDTQIGYVDTGEDGRFNFTVAPGDYSFTLTKYRVTDDTLITSGYFGYDRYLTFTVVDDTVQDIHLPPFHPVRGYTTDGNGVPVPGVGVSATGYLTLAPDYHVNYYPYGTSPNIIRSDEHGYYRLGLNEASFNFEIYPPAGSGFVDTTIPRVEITGEARGDIILTHLDREPPRIVSGPHARHVSATSAVIEWLTDEPADGAADAVGASASHGELTTHHALLLTGLTPSSDYLATVASSDNEGNGPTTATVAFRTGASSDTAAPVIIEGPVVSSIGTDSVTVEWRTDEPADAAVLDADGSVLSRRTDFGVDHRMVVDGLSPATPYLLSVASSDVHGNGPTRSAPVAFTTSATADLQPPVIVAGPIVTGITDQGATVEWETDEPATSGVSVNDGTHYNVLRDERLTTRHSVILTGLTAVTRYTLTTSSKDAAGNGPTLSDPLAFTTLSGVDRDPPVAVGEPRVVGLTHHSALIQWRTDEPADGVVEYGVDAAELSGRVVESRLVKGHVVQLTGLLPDTRYHYRLHSSDSSGNRWSSEVMSLHTRELPDRAAPHFLEAPAVIDADDTTATLYWVTDEPSDAVVEYGEGGVTDRRYSDGRKRREHLVTLTGLTPGASHSFIVHSTDLAGNRASHASLVGGRRSATEASADGGFTTRAVADSDAPLFVAPPTVSYLAPRRAVIQWRTDEIADTRVEYGPASGALERGEADLARGFDHQMVLTNLAPATLYQLRALSTDTAGNRAAAPLISFETSALEDETAPSLTGEPTLSVEGGVIEVRWSTDEPATSKVHYGTAEGELPFEVSEAGLATEHRVRITGIDPTLAWVRVTTVDPAGNRLVGAALRVVEPESVVSAPSSPAPLRAPFPAPAADDPVVRLALEALPTLGDEEQPAVDLDAHVEGAEGVLLERVGSQLGAVFGFDAADQDGASGLLRGSGAGSGVALRPVAVSEAGDDELPGVYSGDGGLVRVVTEGGERIELLPAVAAPERLDDQLLAAGFDTARARSQGRLSTAAGALDYHFQPDPRIVPAAVDAEPGLVTGSREDYPSVPRVTLVYDDGEGAMAQALWPAPAEWESLGEWLRGLPGVSRVELSGDGVLSVQRNGLLLRGVFAYGVTAAVGEGRFRIEPVADLNGDGWPDFRLRYPGGEEQLLFLVEGG